MKKNKILILVIIFILLTSCQKAPVQMIFSHEFETADLAGRRIIMQGYMMTKMPATGEFFYLSNIPYQASPEFTQNLTTIEGSVTVIASKDEWFEWYEGPVEVTGELESGTFTDQYGYQYKFRIADATCRNIPFTELSDTVKAYGALAEQGLITSLFNLLDRAMNSSQILSQSVVSASEIDNLLERINATHKEAYKDMIKWINQFKSANRNSDYEKMAAAYTGVIEWLHEFDINLL